MNTPSLPERLPVNFDIGRFAIELAEAEYALGLLQGSQKKLYNPSLLIAPLTAKEAAVSSKIEGTQSTASDVFIYEAKGITQKEDTAEVANYRKAMLYAIDELRDKKQLTLNFALQLHQILLTGVRHKGSVGKIRGTRVWIAQRAGDPIERAIYVPPEAIHVRDYMENILQYIRTSEDRVLVKAGLVHYQFEAVHPFEDGNGRIGRLLVPLLLYYHEKLTLPIIYLSGYFEANREQYVEALHYVDEHGTFEEWMSFFLRAVKTQANETQKLIEQIYDLHEEIRNSYKSLKSPYIIPLIEFMFKTPVFTIPRLREDLKMTRLTCANLLRRLVADRYLAELELRSGRYKLFGFERLLNIIR
jgi:Fic family protein